MLTSFAFRLKFLGSFGLLILISSSTFASYLNQIPAEVNYQMWTTFNGKFTKGATPRVDVEFGDMSGPGGSFAGSNPPGIISASLQVDAQNLTYKGDTTKNMHSGTKGKTYYIRCQLWETKMGMSNLAATNISSITLQ